MFLNPATPQGIQSNTNSGDHNSQRSNSVPKTSQGFPPIFKVHSTTPTCHVSRGPDSSQQAGKAGTGTPASKGHRAPQTLRGRAPGKNVKAMTQSRLYEPGLTTLLKKSLTKKEYSRAWHAPLKASLASVAYDVPLSAFSKGSTAVQTRTWLTAGEARALHPAEEALLVAIEGPFEKAVRQYERARAPQPGRYLRCTRPRKLSWSWSKGL